MPSETRKTTLAKPKKNSITNSAVKKLKKSNAKLVVKKLSNIQKPTKNSYKTSSGQRVRKVTKHRSLRLSGKQVKINRTLPPYKQLISEPVRLILKNKKLFVTLTLIYSVLVFVFVKGFGSTFDFASTNNQISDYLGDKSKSLGSSVALFEHLIGKSSATDVGNSGILQILITFIMVLATIWLCRELFAGNKPKVKHGFYKGMYPIVPFFLVLVVLAIQLIPLAVGNFLVSTVFGNGLAVTSIEKLLWVSIYICLTVLSIYMISSSIFALLIVTLQDVYPMQALRSARDLVLHRRIGIIGRLAVLVIVWIVFILIIIFPLVVLLPVVAEPALLIVSAFGLVFSTTYIYNLYRKLL